MRKNVVNFEIIRRKPDECMCECQERRIRMQNANLFPSKILINELKQ